MFRPTVLRETDLTRQKRKRRGEVAIIVVLRPDEPPTIQWPRGAKWSDFDEARKALMDAFNGRHKSGDPNEGVRQGWERSNRWKEQEEQERRAYETEHPWVCIHERCSRRFKTERGCKMHENKCRHRTSEAPNPVSRTGAS